MKYIINNWLVLCRSRLVFIWFQWLVSLSLTIIEKNSGCTICTFMKLFLTEFPSSLEFGFFHSAFPPANTSLHSLFVYTTLQGKSHLCIAFLGIARPQSQFPLLMCLWAIYIFPGSVHHIFPCSRIGIGRPSLEIYKSLTDKCMLKIGRQNIIILFWK